MITFKQELKEKFEGNQGEIGDKTEKTFKTNTSRNTERNQKGRFRSTEGENFGGKFFNKED
jgi:hypothetical protein